MIVKFYKTDVSKLIPPYTPGAIYFDSEKKTINIAISDTELEPYCKYNVGFSTSDNVSSIPINDNICYVETSTGGVLNMMDLAEGRDISVIIHNTSLADININIPSTLNNSSVILNNNPGGVSITMSGNGYLELSIIKIASKYFIRYA